MNPGVDMLALARNVAAELGEGWAGREWYHAYGALIDGPDGESLYLRIDTYGTNRRVRISGSYEEFRDITRYGAGDPEITVAPNKAPRLIARDIARRLLPDYRETLETLRYRKARHDAAEMRERAVMGRLGEILPDYQGGRFGRHGQVNGTVRYSSYGDEVTFNEVDVPEAYAHEVAEVLASIQARAFGKA